MRELFDPLDPLSMKASPLDMTSYYMGLLAGTTSLVPEHWCPFYSEKTKLIVIGDSNVGKTCLVHRFADGTFFIDGDTTIGTDFKIRTVDMDGKWVKLQLWDTAGQERYRTIIKDYYRDAQGVMFVYDVTNAQSFENLFDWIQTVSEHAPETVEQVIVGNKSDVDPSMRKVDNKRVEGIADHFGCKFMETSAKSNQNVDEAFMYLARKIFDKMNLGNSSDMGDSVKLSEPSDGKHKQCPCSIM